MTQPGLAFDTSYTLHAAEQAQELTRLDTAKARVLARLQEGPATNVELNAICYRYGARLLELKREGIAWQKEPMGGGVWRYALVTP